MTNEQATLLYEKLYRAYRIIHNHAFEHAECKLDFIAQIDENR
ncbi:hypothetical protein [Paenibacillus polymyxa]|jgi:hypothetical protein|nr:hypothetical protein [Paenibacillus polymyxa]MDY8117180.1 hypothetical protein [Paenibacillus polymyxa]WOZ38501.1 hypothetical protein RQP19_24910 [Paenibacillus polymyxa]